jgi:hypothetical protein
VRNFLVEPFTKKKKKEKTKTHKRTFISSSSSSSSSSSRGMHIYGLHESDFESGKVTVAQRMWVKLKSLKV